MDIRFIYIDKGRKNGSTLYLDVGLKMCGKNRTSSISTYYTPGRLRVTLPHTGDHGIPLRAQVSPLQVSWIQGRDKIPE